jgi:hypothetical protein
MKYKIGDIVRIKNNNTLYVGLDGVEGRIVKIEGSKKQRNFIVRISDGYPLAFYGSELEPVTKSLEELEKGSILVDSTGIKRKVLEKGYWVRLIKDDIETFWSIEQMKEFGLKTYTPKKITVFKHKGKRYPVDMIIKKVKAL